MNFLAHFYLAFGDEHRLVGQFVADAVKGKQIFEFEDKIQQGIWHHRHIDSVTDQHEASSAIRGLIRPKVGLLSPVAVDMLFDHVLAKNWKDYHTSELPDFAQSIYKTLNYYRALLPERMQTTLYYMEKHDWLTSYSRPEGIKHNLTGLSKRVTRGHQLLNSFEFIDNNEVEIHKAFNTVFKDLSNHIKTEIMGSKTPFLDTKHHY